MRGRVIDSNVVIALWHGRPPSPVAVRSEQTARQVAGWWLNAHPDDGLLTPVRLELLGGGQSKDEVRLTEYFLDQFPLFDSGVVLAEDWATAIRLAKRVPHDRRPRGAVDCILRALCQRLHLDLETGDTGVPPA